MTAKTQTPVRPAGGPEAAALTWTSAILGGEITVERGLREGGSPWLIRARGASVVLRVAPVDSRERLATEVAALRHAAGAGLPVPEVLGHDHGTASGFALGPLRPGAAGGPGRGYRAGSRTAGAYVT